MVKNYKSILISLLVSCSLLHGIEKSEYKILEIVRNPKQERPKNTKVIILHNPRKFFIITSNIVGGKKYPEGSNKDREILKEKIIQIIGRKKFTSNMTRRIPSMGYLTIDNLSHKKIKLFLEIEEVAAVGRFKSLNIPKLKRIRKAGSTIIPKNVFNTRSKDLSTTSIK